MSAVQPLEAGRGVQPYAFHRPPRTAGHLASTPFASRDRSVPLYVPAASAVPLGWRPVLRMAPSALVVCAAVAAVILWIGAFR